MKKNGPSHAPVALSSGKQLARYALDRRMVGPQSRSTCDVAEEDTHLAGKRTPPNQSLSDRAISTPNKSGVCVDRISAWKSLALSIIYS
jgi:hypothetical protein